MNSDHWNYVSNGLPLEKTRVLTASYKGVGIGYYIEALISEYLDEGEDEVSCSLGANWYVVTDLGIREAIEPPIAWMALPDPPKNSTNSRTEK